MKSHTLMPIGNKINGEGGDSMSNGNGSSSTRAFGGVVAIVAVIACVYAMVNPMNLRISSLENHNMSIEKKISQDDIREREDAREFALLNNSNKQHEQRIAKLEESVRDWKEKYIALNTEQSEKIKKMEWYIYGRATASMFGGMPSPLNE